MNETKLKDNQYYQCKNLNTHEYCGIRHRSLKSAINHCDRMPRISDDWTVRQITGEGTPFRYER